jgi:hypothetical protein
MNRTACARLFRMAAYSAVLCFVSVQVACDDGKEETHGTTVMIHAATGGTVAMESDETSLNIPAGSLAIDTEITLSYGELSDYGALANARSRVLVMEPAGTTLSSPAAVLIDPGTPAIGATQTVTVYQWVAGVDGGWSNPREAQVVSMGLVSTSVTYLAPLAIVVEDPVVGPTGTISGSVFHIYTEQPLEGMSFTLLSGATEVDTAVSDAQGGFLFTEVPVGTYTVHSEITEADNCFGDPVDKEAVVTEDATTDVFFGFVPPPCG